VALDVKAVTHALHSPRPPLLLALDCDGTLLDPSGAIRPRVREAVRAAAAAGAVITLATARRLQSARRFAEELGVRTPLVLGDGATVQDPLTGAVLYLDPLPTELVARLIDLSMDHGLHPVVHRVLAEPAGDAMHVLVESEAYPPFAAYLAGRSPVFRGNLDELRAALPVSRFAARGEDGLVQSFFRRIQDPVDRLGCEAYLVVPAATAGDAALWGAFVRNGGCSKARAVEALAQRYGLTLADCVAVGDAHNDVELLREVGDAGGASVAMGQAPAEVKAAARYTVGTNEEDGVAEAIERYALPRLAAAQRGGADAGLRGARLPVAE
jgi:5-amino-6-(5-phospho-D-ribitylamino)uracil phosphatase